MSDLVSDLNNLDRNDRFQSRRGVDQVITQWLDSQGYDLDQISIDQEIEYLTHVRASLKQAGIPMTDLPGGGRLLMSYRMDHIQNLAWKRWRSQTCDTMVYPFTEYVRQGMIWPVETRQDRLSMVERVQQIEKFIQSLDGMRRVCKDKEHDAGVMYVKRLDISDSRMWMVIRLATTVSRMNDAVYSRLADPEQPHTCCGIKFLHNLYERPARGQKSPRPGYYNITGLPTRLIHHNPNDWDQMSVLEAVPGRPTAEFHSSDVQDVINNIKQIHDWMQEHARGTDRVADFDF